MTFLPLADRRYLAERGLMYQEVEHGGQKGIVLESFLLPGSRFDAERADILILLPPGYPDTAPDMFYLLPWVRLAGKGAYPRAADVRFDFDGKTWQRWSRHEPQWRPGVDGIWTMLKRVERALEVAA